MKTNYLVQEYKNSTKTVFRSRTSEIWNRMILRKCLFFLRLHREFRVGLVYRPRCQFLCYLSFVQFSLCLHFCVFFYCVQLLLFISFSPPSLPLSFFLSLSTSLPSSLSIFFYLSFSSSLSLSPLALAQCVWVCACVHEWRLSPERGIHPACFSGMLKWLLNWSSQLCLVFILNTFDLSEHMLARVCTCPHRSEILYTVRPTGLPAVCR